MLVGDSRMLVYDDTDSEEPVKVHDRGVVLQESADFGLHQLTYRYGDTLAPHIDGHRATGGPARQLRQRHRGPESAALRMDGSAGPWSPRSRPPTRRGGPAVFPVDVEVTAGSFVR